MQLVNALMKVLVVVSKPLDVKSNLSLE
jgi:hypothetical protein